MAINESVRLHIEVVGANEGAKQIRELAAEVRKLRAVFQQAAGGVGDYRKVVREEARKILADMNQLGGQMQKASENLGISESTVQATKRRADEIRSLLEDVAEAKRRAEEATSARAAFSGDMFSSGAREVMREETLATGLLVEARRRLAEALENEQGAWADLRNAIIAVEEAQAGVAGAESMDDYAEAMRALSDAKDRLIAAEQAAQVEAQKTGASLQKVAQATTQAAQATKAAADASESASENIGISQATVEANRKRAEEVAAALDSVIDKHNEWIRAKDAAWEGMDGPASLASPEVTDLLNAQEAALEALNDSRKKLHETIKNEPGLWAEVREAIEKLQEAQAKQRTEDPLRGGSASFEQSLENISAVRQAMDELVAVEDRAIAALQSTANGLREVAQASDDAAGKIGIQQSTVDANRERVKNVLELMTKLKEAQDALAASEQDARGAGLTGTEFIDATEDAYEGLIATMEKLANSLRIDKGLWEELRVAMAKYNEANDRLRDAEDNLDGSAASSKEYAEAMEEAQAATSALADVQQQAVDALAQTTTGLEAGVKAGEDWGSAMKKMAAQQEEATRQQIKSQQRLARVQGNYQSARQKEVSIMQAEQDVRKRGNLLLIDSGRLIQDLAYGWRAAVNNLDPLILNSERYANSVKIANQSTNVWAASLRGLFAVLASPAGLLLTVSLFATLSMHTSIFDKFAESAKNFFNTVIRGNKVLADMEKNVRKAFREAAQVAEDVSFEEIIREVEVLDARLSELVSEKRAMSLQNRLKLIGFTWNTYSAIFGQTAKDMQAANAEIDEETKRTRFLLEQYAEVLKESRESIYVLAQGDPRIITAEIQKIRDAYRKGHRDMIEVRRRAGRENAEVEVALVRNASEERLRQLQIEQGHMIGRLIANNERKIYIQKQLAGRVSEVQRLAFERELESIDAYVAEVARRLSQLNALIAAEPEFVDAEVAEINRAAAERARALVRQVEDAQRAATEAYIRAEYERVVEAVKLAEHEAETKRIMLRRQVEDLWQNSQRRRELERANNEHIEQINRQTAQEVSRLWREFYDERIAVAEQARRAEEDRDVALGDRDMIEVWRERIQRAKDYVLAVEEGTDTHEAAVQKVLDAERELAQEQRRRSRQLRLSFAQDERAMVAYERQLRRLREEIEEAYTPTRRRAFDLPDTRALELLEARKAAYEEEARVAEEAWQALLRQFRGREDLSDAERELLRQGVEATRNASVEVLRAQQEVAREERRIFDARVRAAEDWAANLIRIVQDAMTEQRRYTDLDVDYERFQQRQRARELERSFRTGKMRAEEYHMERRRMAQQTAEFEKDVERDRASFLEKTARGIADLVIEEGKRQMAAFVGQMAAQLVFGQFAAKAAAKTSGAAMKQITATAAPAAAAVNIATLGAAGAAGTASSIASLAAVVAAFEAAIARAGGKGFSSGGYTGNRKGDPPFSGGGWTGHGGKFQVAGTVHHGEFVMPVESVQGQPAPFYALMDALKRGIVRPTDIMEWMKGLSAGVRTSLVNAYNAAPTVTRQINANQVLYAAGLPGYAEGGPVIASTALFPEPTGADLRPLLNATLGVQDSIEGLARSLEQRANVVELNVGGRTADNLNRAGSRYRGERITPNGFIRRNR